MKLERGYGWADVENRVPMEAASILRIGSLTKPVTASATLIAVASGKLALDDRICELISGCPVAWSPVTLRHLLTHTSGIRDHFGDLEAVPVEATATELGRVLSTLDPEEPLSSMPGEEYSYSNFNYVLLGVALEVVYGSPWEEVLRINLFDPLGLQDTAYDDVFSIVPGRARGYGRDDQDTLRNIEYDDHAAYSAGGLRSTASDLLSWSETVFSGDLLGEELTRASFTPFQGNYGYGWQIRDFFDRRLYNHTGGIDGFSSHIAHYPEEQLTIIVLSNVEEDSAILGACDAAALWFEWREVPVEPTSWLELEPRVRCGLEAVADS
jgi:CubicO group peptidase (beta-lactamase class C family)